MVVAAVVMTLGVSTLPARATTGTQPNRALYMWQEPSGVSLRTIPYAGGAPQPVPNGDGALNPRWSNDHLIAFTKFDGNDWEIFTMRRGGSHLTNLTDTDATDVDPAWSADGRSLIFMSDRGGQWDIWTMGRDGSDVMQVTNTPEVEYSPVWSGRKGWIAYAATNVLGDTHVFRILADGSHLRQLTSGVERDDYPTDWSPDGHRVLIARFFEAGGGTVFSLRGQGGGVQQILGPERGPGWAEFLPSGDAVVVEHDVPGPPPTELFTVGTDGTGWSRLTRNAHPDLLHVWLM